MCDCNEGACQGDINAILADLNRKLGVLAKVLYDGLTALEDVLEWKDGVNLRLDSIYAELDDLAGCDDDEEDDEDEGDDEAAVFTLVLEDNTEMTPEQFMEQLKMMRRAISESA